MPTTPMGMQHSYPYCGKTCMNAGSCRRGARYRLYKMGEIKFWRDYIFERDLAKLKKGVSK
jgi:hypothetical protein